MLREESRKPGVHTRILVVLSGVMVDVGAARGVSGAGQGDQREEDALEVFVVWGFGGGF
jgi:hypothetical protein